jgi:dolichyl-phosphate-mannose--protein O-mannosyl transferase
MMEDEIKWLMYTEGAVMQVKCKYCIWSEFIEATRVLKMIHRENMRTRLQQQKSIDDPMLLKSLRKQHLTEENRKIHCIINYLSYWSDAGTIGQASST